MYFSDIFKYHLYGLGGKFKVLLIKRFELTTLSSYLLNNIFLTLYFKNYNKNFVKTLNIIFSQINNVNIPLKELKKINILRKYLIKSYKGYCHFIGKPVRGQRTWSNGWSSFKSNNVLRDFISKLRYIKSLSKTNSSTQVDFRSIKKRYTLGTNNSKNKLSNTSRQQKISNGNKLWY